MQRSDIWHSLRGYSPMWWLGCLLLLSLAFSLLTSEHANAWEGEIPVCEATPDYSTALEAVDGFDAETSSVVIFKRNWGGAPFYGGFGMAINNTSQHQFDESGTIRYFSAPSNTAIYTINNDGTLTSQGTGSYTFDDVPCITMALNVTYLSSWTGQTFPDGTTGGEIDAPPSEPCDWFDMVCVLQKIWHTLTNGFNNLADLIGGLVMGIVEPIVEAFTAGEDNTSFVSDAFGNLNTGMREKLGFLLFPFDFMASIFSALMTVVDSPDKSEWHCTDEGGTACGNVGLCANNVLGDSPVCFNIGELEKRFEALWLGMIIFVRFAVVIALVELMRQKYYSVVTR